MYILFIENVKYKTTRLYSGHLKDRSEDIVGDAKKVRNPGEAFKEQVYKDNPRE